MKAEKGRKKDEERSTKGDGEEGRKLKADEKADKGRKKGEGRKEERKYTKEERKEGYQGMKE